MTDAALIGLIPRWLAWSRNATVAIGLSREEAITTARRILRETEEHSPSSLLAEVDNEDAKDVLHALVRIVIRETTVNVTTLESVYQLILRFPFEDHERSEKGALLREAAALGWDLLGIGADNVRQMRRDGCDPHTKPRSHLAKPEVAELANELNQLGQLSDVQPGRKTISYLFDYCARLWRLSEFNVSEAKRLSSVAWGLLEAAPKAGLFDERCYFQGELARLAGVACRLEGAWEEASRWFDEAEAAYLQTTDSVIGFAHVAYARLALLYHRYEYALVIQSAGSLAELLEGLGMHTRAAKCRLAAAMATKALGRTGEAVILFEELASAHSDAAPGFALHVLSHLADGYKEQGRLWECRTTLAKAAQYLELSGQTIAAADFRLVYADFLRAIGKHEAAADGFRRSKEAFQALGMQPFAGYAAVFLAETLMILRRPQEAEDEVRWALPLLEQLEMLPEGCVAIALLQESISARRLDQDTLRAFRKTLKL